MKRLVFSTAAFFVATMAFAQTPRSVDDKMTGCIFFGGSYQAVAAYRDGGLSPQQAFASMKLDVTTGKYGISADGYKKIINLVYFDPGFTYARGQALSDQMRNFCLRDGNPQFEPLK